MDLGTRANTGLARSIDVEIWNVSEATSLASETYNFPLSGTGFIERRAFVLSYDNTAPSLVGDMIDLPVAWSSIPSSYFSPTTATDAFEKQNRLPPPLAHRGPHSNSDHRLGNHG